MRSVVSRILTDRFWQAGISEGSKDDFYARVTGTKSTMEGFASSVRGPVRTVREACYSILMCMSRLGVDFYGFNELPGPLAHALFADAHFLSSHQLIALLTLVRLMVEDCPLELRSHFISPILASCFAQMDAKCSSEWGRLEQKSVAPADGDNLTEEMKEESILRQLTHSAVMMIGGLLDPARPSKSPSESLYHNLTVFQTLARTQQQRKHPRTTLTATHLQPIRPCVNSALLPQPSWSPSSSSALTPSACATADAVALSFESSDPSSPNSHRPLTTHRCPPQFANSSARTSSKLAYPP